MSTKLRKLEDLSEADLRRVVIHNTAARCLADYDFEAWVTLLTDGCSTMGDMDRDLLMQEAEIWEMTPEDVDKLIAQYFPQPVEIKISGVSCLGYYAEGAAAQCMKWTRRP